MNLEFFPSRTLTLYLAKLFVTRTITFLVMLVLVLQTLDLLGESGKILAHPGNGEAELWTYVSLRVPQLIARFLPYSVLLATIFVLAGLNQNSEVIAMKAAGMSAHQVLAPLILAAVGVAAVSFAFNERVVTRATATLKAWAAAEYGAVPKDPAAKTNFYLRDGPNILLAGSLSGSGDKTVMENVTWYRRDAAGMVTEQVRSPTARWVAPGWRLDDPVRFTVASTVTAKLPPFTVAPQIQPADLVMSKVDADALDAVTLYQSIEQLKAAGRRTSELEAKLWHKFSGPMAAILMPLLGAVAAFGLARSGALLVRSIIGMALGFAYFVVDNAALAMGDFGGYPPLVAAWAPFLLFLMVGETVLVRTEE